MAFVHVEMYSYSNRHRMHEQEFPFKEGDDVCYTETNSVTGEDMIASGTLFEVMKDQVIVQTGNGGRGLEYVRKDRILQRKAK